MLLAPSLQGITLQFEVRIQRSQGPGNFQPYRDLWKLFHKQIVYPEAASWLYWVMPITFSSRNRLSIGAPRTPRPNRQHPAGRSRGSLLCHRPTPADRFSRMSQTNKQPPGKTVRFIRMNLSLLGRAGGPKWRRYNGHRPARLLRRQRNSGQSVEYGCVPHGVSSRRRQERSNASIGVSVVRKKVHQLGQAVLHRDVTAQADLS